MPEVLANKRVLVTRPDGQADELMHALEERGAQALHLPTIRFTKNKLSATEEQMLSQLKQYDYLIFTSVNGVRFFCEHLEDRAMLDSLKDSASLIAIGPKTAALVHERFERAAIVPEKFVSEAIVECLSEEQISGKRFLLARADLARKNLAVELRSRGAEVDDLTVYKIESALNEEALSGLKNTLGHLPLDVVTLTSAKVASETAEALRRLSLSSCFQDSLCVCIGPITETQAVAEGFKKVIAAKEYTSEGIVRAIDSFFSPTS